MRHRFTRAARRIALRSAPAMGLQFECKACGRRLTVPSELFANKIRGRIVTVKCKGCGAPIGIDGTIPPPAIEPKESTHSGSSKPDVVQDNAKGPSVGQSTTMTTLPPEPKAAQVPVEKSAKDTESMPSSGNPTSARSLATPQSAFPAPAKLPNVATDIRALDESWDADPVEEHSDRFSHVDGPLPIKLPTAIIGRYALFDQFAEGGIATVHFGRIDGAGGFSRIVAIKRLLPHLVANDEFTEMLLKEARFAARVRHPNVVPTLDVVASQGDVLLVLEYIHGESLSALCRKQAKSRKDHFPVEIAVAVMLDVLSGLSAVHEATDEKGRLLGLVHRDISPPNVVVGADGYARVLDFGIAKALEHIEESMPTRLKGKIGYMAPEQIRGEGVSQRSDVFAAGVILWELLATRRLFASKNESERMKEIVAGNYPELGRYRSGIPKDLERATMRALSVNPDQRFNNSREFADALEQASPRASARRVAEWVGELAAETLAERARMMAQVENWNSGIDIPLRSSAFAAEGVQAQKAPSIPPGPKSLRPPEVGSEVTAPNALGSNSNALLAESKSHSRASPWLFVAACVILLLALYYTIWK